MGTDFVLSYFSQLITAARSGNDAAFMDCWRHKEKTQSVQFYKKSLPVSSNRPTLFTGKT